MTELSEDQRIAALKAADAAAAVERAGLCLPRLRQIADLLTARRANTAELERLATSLPWPTVETQLGLLTKGVLGRGEDQALSLLASAVQIMIRDCETKLAAAEGQA